jgi:hypothetical protein
MLYKCDSPSEPGGQANAKEKEKEMSDTRRLIDFIRGGATPYEMITGLNVPPSRLRRMLASRRVQKVLQLEEDIARVLTKYRHRVETIDTLRNLRGLETCEKPETARRACEAGLKSAQAGAATGASGQGAPYGLTLEEMRRLGRITPSEHELALKWPEPEQHKLIEKALKRGKRIYDPWKNFR